MRTQAEKVRIFRGLHLPGTPAVLFNVWDAGSAAAVAAAGAPALATGSWPVAAAHGLADGENLPLDLAIANLERIVAKVDLPVSIDLESGYGADAEGVGATVARAAAAGAVGCNIEDSVPATGKLRDVAEQVARLQAARQAAAEFFINARTDVYFKRSGDETDAELFDAAVARAKAFADAGADGLFVPGLLDLDTIARLARAQPLPLNILKMKDEPTIADLARAGVARISHGPFPYRLAMKALSDATAALYGTAKDL